MITTVELNVQEETPVTLQVNEVVTGSGNPITHTSSYNGLENKPKIEGVVLQGDRSFEQLGMQTMTVQDIEKILYLD